MPQTPLAGIRVLEVGNYMAGPFCGMQLADLGADVVKVEDPRGGDLARRLEPLVNGESGNFVRLNRGKRSIALDLKQDAGRDVFRRLAARADVIVENLRPGTMTDLGLDPRSLLDANGGLVYAAVTGWGLDGPYADRPALDIIVQAMSGLMSVTGAEDGPPVKVGVSISDLVAGLYATIGILTALSVRATVAGSSSMSRCSRRPCRSRCGRPERISRPARCLAPPGRRTASWGRIRRCVPPTLTSSSVRRPGRHGRRSAERSRSSTSSVIRASLTEISGGETSAR